jgi:hypothetical protein
MSGLGIAVPVGCVATLKLVVAPVCVVGGALTWGAACAVAFIPWAVVCSSVAKCVLIALDDPPAITRVLADEVPSDDTCWRSEERGGQRGILKVPRYELKIEATDDREPFEGGSTLELCGGDETFSMLADCDGQETSLHISVPFGKGDYWRIRASTTDMYGSPPPLGMSMLWSGVETYGPAASDPEWAACGRDGQACCLDAPVCDQGLTCEQDTCRGDPSQTTGPVEPLPPPDEGPPTDRGSRDTVGPCPKGGSGVVGFYYDEATSTCMCYECSDGVVELIECWRRGTVSPCYEVPDLGPIDS